MRRYSMLLCLLVEIGDSLPLDHGFWGFGSDLLFCKEAEGEER